MFMMWTLTSCDINCDWICISVYRCVEENIGDRWDVKRFGLRIDWKVKIIDGKREKVINTVLYTLTEMLIVAKIITRKSHHAFSIEPKCCLCWTYFTLSCGYVCNQKIIINNFDKHNLLVKRFYLIFRHLANLLLISVL